MQHTTTHQIGTRVHMRGLDQYGTIEANHKRGLRHDEPLYSVQLDGGSVADLVPAAALTALAR